MISDFPHGRLLLLIQSPQPRWCLASLELQSILCPGSPAWRSDQGWWLHLRGPLLQICFLPAASLLYYQLLLPSSSWDCIRPSLSPFWAETALKLVSTSHYSAYLCSYVCCRCRRGAWHWLRSTSSRCWRSHCWKVELIIKVHWMSVIDVGSGLTWLCDSQCSSSSEGESYSLDCGRLN